MSLRPERWADLPAATANIPGVWGHLLTFLGGPRACIGFRFSLVEYVPSLRPTSSAQMRSSALFSQLRLRAG